MVARSNYSGKKDFYTRSYQSRSSAWRWYCSNINTHGRGEMGIKLRLVDDMYFKGTR